ncbi:SusC/RagA family TonB-linked outer membrane protein [Neptunitalea sp. Y10]|uniref:SusC/RagA family TonB-linked outer membrane protein n=2 Tax=Neptunitalea lumnitzerae TaxID=2965509 RepID=A0ABQ5MHA8_9FLAO|nr:SusC/RagA family TonB-linked outer membrane protein [Neptunitalea sp. Y10]
MVSAYGMQAQTTITGTIISGEDDSPLPGASVMIKGTSTGTSTDFDGNYSLSGVNQGDVLEFSYVGFITKEITVGTETVISVTLEVDATTLDDVVVVGYGTQKKEQVTSSVASVSSEEFVTPAGSSDVGSLIQGKVAGVSIVQNSGDPTAGTQVRLRGTSTLLGTNTSPLVIIDGVPGDFNTVAPQDIESISVLKDGSAAAMYGTRGTNGVILVTTKRASGSYDSKVTYSASVSTQEFVRTLDMLSAQDYRDQVAAGTRPIAGAASDLGYDTDWLDVITRTPISHTHNVTFRGGDFKTNYLATVNVRELEGMFLKSDNKILTGRVDINHSMFDDKLRFNFGYLVRGRNFTTTADGGSFNGYTYRQALIRNPTSPVRHEDGSWDSNELGEVGNFNYENPLGRIKESDGRNKSNFTRLNSRIDYNPFDGLKLSALLSLSRYNETRGYYETKNHISNIRDGVNGYVSNGTLETEDKLMELTAQYSKTLGEHDFTVLGGYSYQSFYNHNYWMSNTDFQTDIFGFDNIGLGLGLAENKARTGIGSFTSMTNLISFFGRLNYAYKDKYLLQASLRYEAASQLYKTEDPWGAFPAISAGWRISEEDFMKSVKFISDLKVRVGYGVTGTPNSDGFGAVALLGYSDPFYYDGNWIRTLTPTQNPNPYLKWEEKHETNIGLDFGLFDNFITGNIDYYQRNIKDLLYDYQVPVPPNFVSTTRANVGEISNSGLEVLINVNAIQTEDFEWTTSVNFSTNKSKLEQLSNDLYQAQQDYFYTGATGEPIQQTTHIVQVGQPIGNFYGFKVVDVDDEGRWIYEDADGTLKNYDEFGRGYENMQVLGNGLPNYYAGWNNSFKYKNFDLSVTMRGAFDYQIINYNRMYLENPTLTQYNRLASSKEPVFGKTQLTSPQEFNSYYVEDGDFWKIDNITLGYNLGELGKYISSARVYVTTSNTFLITGYKGIDPEVNFGGLSPGVDSRDTYPTTRNFTLGFDVSF